MGQKLFSNYIGPFSKLGLLAVTLPYDWSCCWANWMQLWPFITKESVNKSTQHCKDLFHPNNWLSHWTPLLNFNLHSQLSKTCFLNCHIISDHHNAVDVCYTIHPGIYLCFIQSLLYFVLIIFCCFYFYYFISHYSENIVMEGKKLGMSWLSFSVFITKKLLISVLATQYSVFRIRTAR